MRRSMLASVLAALFSLALGTSAFAAAAPSQTFEIVGGISFQSILGGSLNGTAILTGDLANGEVGSLKGTANVPLRDLSLTISPLTTIALTTQTLNQFWQYPTCDQFGCTWTSGVAIWEYQRAQGPVDVRLGQMRGTGNLSFNTAATCVADCPPPQSYYVPIYPGASVNGSVLGSKDAGTFSINGTIVIR
jgi:hypothetical protein